MHSSLPSRSCTSRVVPCSVRQLTNTGARPSRPGLALLCRATPSNWRTALSGTQQDEHTSGSTSGHVHSGNGNGGSAYVPESYPPPPSSFNGNSSHSSSNGSNGASGRGGSASPVYRRPPMRASRMGDSWRKEFDPSGETQNQGELDTLRAIEEEVAAMKREEEEEERRMEEERQRREAREAAAAARRASSSESSSSSSSSSSGNGAPSRFRSSWDAKEAGGGRHQDADYLYELGRSQQYNINVTHGQSADFIDSLFTGNVLGHKSDIADGSLHKYEFRSFENIVGDYYVAPRFLERVAMHVAKNAMVDIDAFDTKIRCPLILGVWGEKGMGKTFQTELALKKLGVKTVVMSAGELEHEWAGTPGKLIRERYRRAAEIRKVHGKLSCLLINDIDAGIGHFENTQVTVNNQMVVGTLMNLCDDPNHVSIGQVWRDSDFVNRVPIIVTGNDFSTLFAPLVRDGRMDKFYWKPERDDIVAILHQMYKEDGLTRRDMEQLLDTFHQQPLDFFGALRAATYDNQIRTWIKDEVVGNDLHVDDSNMAALSQRLLQKDRLPQFEPVQLTLDMLLREGARLEREQAMVNSHNLAKDYLKHMKKVKGGGTIVGFGG